MGYGLWDCFNPPSADFAMTGCDYCFRKAELLPIPALEGLLQDEVFYLPQYLTKALKYGIDYL